MSQSPPVIGRLNPRPPSSERPKYLEPEAELLTQLESLCSEYIALRRAATQSQGVPRDITGQPDGGLALRKASAAISALQDELLRYKRALQNAHADISALQDGLSRHKRVLD